MTRRIEFRAFDVQKKRITLLGYDIDGNGKLCISTEIELMLFTGLRDKSGVDIYEGDIIKTPTGKIMVVAWDKRRAAFVIEREGYNFRHFFGDAFDAIACKVLGNIYENSDLLN